MGLLVCFFLVLTFLLYIHNYAMPPLEIINKLPGKKKKKYHEGVKFQSLSRSSWFISRILASTVCIIRTELSLLQITKRGKRMAVQHHHQSDGALSRGSTKADVVSALSSIDRGSQPVFCQIQTPGDWLHVMYI